jgi:hypothetical protein
VRRLAQYFNTDATLIRVLFVVLGLLGGPGIVIYLPMWIVVPEEPLGAASWGPRFTPSLRHLRSRTACRNAG